MFKKFISYYKPYKLVFFLDLMAATGISLVDLAYPQFLRRISSTLFLQDSALILQKLPLICLLLVLSPQGKMALPRCPGAHSKKLPLQALSSQACRGSFSILIS